MVVVYHTTQSAAKLSVQDGGLPGEWPAWLWPFNIGAHGVAAFFMISGFVICITLGRIRTAGQFARARFFRLYPIFWVAVLFTGIWRFMAGGEAITWQQILANFTLVPTWLGQPYVDGVYWTLEVEIKFYLMMAVIWHFGMLERISLICSTWLSLTIIIKLLQVKWPELEALQWCWQAFMLPFAPFFSIGMLSYKIAKGQAGRTPYLLILLCLGLVFGSGNLPRFMVSLVFSIVLLLIANGVTHNLRLPRSLIFLGSASYCIYLFHQAYGYQILRYVIPRSDISSPLIAVLVIAICVFTALAAHKWVELPLAKLTKRWK